MTVPVSGCFWGWFLLPRLPCIPPLKSSESNEPQRLLILKVTRVITFRSLRSGPVSQYRMQKGTRSQNISNFLFSELILRELKTYLATEMSLDRVIKHMANYTCSSTFLLQFVPGQNAEKTLCTGKVAVQGNRCQIL